MKNPEVIDEKELANENNAPIKTKGFQDKVGVVCDCGTGWILTMAAEFEPELRLRKVKEEKVPKFNSNQNQNQISAPKPIFESDPKPEPKKEKRSILSVLRLRR